MPRLSDPERSSNTQVNPVAMVSDRRRTPRGRAVGEPGRAELVSLIVGTYREMPGLYLDLAHAARMFGLRDATCRVVLDDLVRQGRLRNSRGLYAAI